MSGPQPGVLFTGSYLTGNYNPGVPGGPSVYDTLANPPASGVVSETSGKEEMLDLGIQNANAFGAATKIMSANVDAMKNFYDGSGVVGVNNDNVI